MTIYDFPSLAEDGIVQNTNGTLSLLRIVPQTTAVGFGVDLVCVDDIDPTSASTDPFTVATLAQDAYHRLTTRRGTLPDDPDFGIDVFEFLHGAKSPADLRACEGRATTELQKDDRIHTATVTVTYDALSRRLSISCAITPEDPALQVFDLIIAVTDGGALLQAISARA